MSLEEEETDWVIVFISQQQLSSMLESELESESEHQYKNINIILQLLTQTSIYILGLFSMFLLNYIKQ